MVESKTLTGCEVYLEIQWKEAEPLFFNDMLVQGCGMVTVECVFVVVVRWLLKKFQAVKNRVRLKL